MARYYRLLIILCLLTSIAMIVTLAACHYTDSTTIHILSALPFLALLFADLLYSAFVRHRTGSLLRPLSILLVWGIVSLVIANGFIALLGREADYWTAFGPDPRTGWYPKKGLESFRMYTGNGDLYLVSTDMYGHRNRTCYPENLEIPYLVQGDSNVFGYGLAYQDTLCATLDNLSGRSAFFNFGVSGFDCNHYYYQYKMWQGHFRIKQRIILFNGGNDFTLTACKTAYFVRRPYLEAAGGDSVVEVGDYVSPAPVQAYDSLFVDRYSSHNHLIHSPKKLYCWANGYPDVLLRIPLVAGALKKAYWLLHRFAGNNPDASAAAPLDLSYPDWLILKRDRWPQPFLDFSRDFPLILGKIFAQNRNLLICLFPMRTQVIEAEFQAAKKRLYGQGYQETDIDPNAVGNYMRDVCQRLGIDFLDVTEAFKRYPEPAKLFQIKNQHLSKAGMELCAQSLWTLLNADNAH